MIGEKGNEAKRESFSVKTDEGVWDGKKLETPNIAVVDPGIGEEMIIRRFDFALPPKVSGAPPVSDEEMLAHHKGRIISFLWKDGWEIAGDIKTLRKKDHFFVMIPCKAAVKNGMKQMIYDKPMNLNRDILNRK